MDFRELLNKLDSIAEAGYSKEPVRFTVQDVMPHIDEIKFTEPSPSMLKYSIANNPDFTDKDINDPKVKTQLFQAELKRSPARLFGDVAARIKPYNDEQIEISNIVNQVSDELASGNPIKKDHQQFLMAVLQKALKDMELIRDPDQTPFDDEDDEDEFESITPNGSDELDEDVQLSEGNLKILWDEEPVKRGKGYYQPIQYADGTRGMMPMAIDGRPIWTGSVPAKWFADDLVDMGFGLPAYKTDDWSLDDAQDAPKGYDDSEGEYVGTHRKVGSRWVTIDQSQQWEKPTGGDFYTDRSDSLGDMSYSAWRQEGEVRDIKHDLKMLAYQLQKADATDKLEWREAILTVNRAYRGDKKAFEKMKDMIDNGTDIQVYIAGAGLRGSREIKGLVQDDQLKRAAMDRAFAARKAHEAKKDAMVFAAKAQMDLDKTQSDLDSERQSFDDQAVLKKVQNKAARGDYLGIAMDPSVISWAMSNPGVIKNFVRNNPDQVQQFAKENPGLANLPIVKDFLSQNPDMQKYIPTPESIQESKLDEFELSSITSGLSTFINVLNLPKNLKAVQDWFTGLFDQEDEVSDKPIKNPYEGDDAKKFDNLTKADQAWLVKGDKKPDINDEYILMRAPNKGKSLEELAREEMAMAKQAAKIKNPYTGADAEKFEKLYPADKIWLTKGGGKPDINDEYIAARAPKKLKEVPVEVDVGTPEPEQGAKTYPLPKRDKIKMKPLMPEPGEKGYPENDPEVKNLFKDLELESVKEWFNGLTDVTLNGDEFYEHFNWVEENLEEAEYQGRSVQLNKPMRGDVKKFKVYVKNNKGNVVKVNFGDPDMKIKAYDPERRRSFRARHNCDNPGPKWKARYWSCRKW